MGCQKKRKKKSLKHSAVRLTFHPSYETEKSDLRHSLVCDLLTRFLFCFSRYNDVCFAPIDRHAWWSSNCLTRPDTYNLYASLGTNTTDQTTHAETCPCSRSVYVRLKYYSGVYEKCLKTTILPALSKTYKLLILLEQCVLILHNVNFIRYGKLIRPQETFLGTNLSCQNI